MKLHYIEYCLADRLFYEDPKSLAVDEDGFAPVGGEVPEGWRTYRQDPWFYCMHSGASLPKQGWKIHVSAGRKDAQTVLDIVSDYCFDKQISFKFLVNGTAFVRRNMKYADRSGSGKFITIYPLSDQQLDEILHDLDPKLQGMGGAYILTDLRWKDGPLYLRYGGFVERHTRNDLGEPVLAIEDPQGALVPDNRDPVFTLPEWVEPPDVLREAIDERRRSTPPEGFPYTVESALHFSNGGGVYLAHEHASGRKVVLKEARPGAGLDQRGRDAVDRLKSEYATLRRLAGVRAVVDCYDYFELWEHHFLVQEYIEGTPLNKDIVAGSPLIRAHTTQERIDDYTRWALSIGDQVRAAVEQVHAAGMAFGDLHPNNILVTPDGSVRLVDCELSSEADQDEGRHMGAPGYIPPDQRDATAADYYALACVQLSLFLPITMLFTLDTTSAPMLARYVEEHFPLPAGWAAQVLADLDLGPSPWAGTPEQMRRTRRLITPGADPRDDWPELAASIARGIRNSATPDREDRLFPGDVEQFRLGGLGFGYGAAGVLYALAKTGHGRDADHERWLLDRVRAHSAPHRLGFYDGLHGIAHTFAELGELDAARDVLELSDASGPVDLGDDLFAGRSGIALNQLHLARALDDRSLADAAEATARELAHRLRTDPPRPEDGNGRRRKAGLMHGTSGPALLFIRLYEATGDREYLDHAEHALGLDLDCCVATEDGDALYVDEGWRLMPYLAVGSAGVGTVLGELVRHRPSEPLRTALDRLTRATLARFHICPMLFHGTAGQMAYLHHVRDRLSDDTGMDDHIRGHREQLRLHMLGLRGEVAFPGDQLMRLSMDLATGSAGILLALHTQHKRDQPFLPFLSPFHHTGN
jgi:serine/threonine protein kinase